MLKEEVNNFYPGQWGTALGKYPLVKTGLNIYSERRKRNRTVCAGPNSGGFGGWGGGWRGEDTEDPY
jgi:hypothetical protein